ncbi:hypothetical protein L6164_018137 [Bauhinia variegata]|uniref:Uncharacterized protein n=1 Tax=Bauhinia variegata TaxID=167791 RepID=A0ACB9NBZ2_BAUVA|nr:hypothetical protein L6164_018137 [Bauhinia variegata]
MVEDKVLNFFLVFSLLWLWANAKVELPSDSLKPGDVLNISDKLCSASGNYCMQFDVTDVTYLQIIQTSGSWVIWTANRDQPSLNYSGVLTLDYSGTLKITRQHEEPITLYNSTQGTNISSIATLFDSGNFVLQELYPNGSVKSTLWQSFDYPTDTLVPGMRLGVNGRTGQSWLLVSYESDESPASGAFTLEWEPTSAQLIIRRRGQIYWASGILKNNKFECISEQVQDMYEYNVDNDSFSYTPQNGEYVQYWALYDSGKLADSQKNEIASADQCYGYNTDAGCQTWNIPSCRHDGQTFNTLKGEIKGQYNTTVVPLDTSLRTMSDCEAACWNNCDCVGIYSFSANRIGCISIHGDWEFTSSDDGESFRMIMPKPSEHNGRKKKILVGAVVATILFILCVGIIWLIQKIRKEKRRTMETGRNLRVFSYASVMKATNGFSLDNKLGEGGFGSVYKGKLQMSIEVAIKRLSSFGVLILEIVSNQRNNRFGSLVRHAWELWRDGMGLKLLDPAINVDSFVQDQVLRCIHVALLCLEELAFDRPNMSEILSMLTNENAILSLPQNPAIDIGGRDNVEENETPAIRYTDTRNGLTISNMSAR